MFSFPCNLLEWCVPFSIRSLGFTGPWASESGQCIERSNLYSRHVFSSSLCSFATILQSEDNQFFFWLQTYIDCLHIRKTDKSRMQAADLMDTENGSSRNEEDNPADHEDKVLWFLFLWKYYSLAFFTSFTYSSWWNCRWRNWESYQSILISMRN